MNLRDAIEQFLAHRRLRGVSTGTLNQYSLLLSTWAEWREQQGHGPEISDIDISELRSFMAHLQKRITHMENNHRPPGGPWSASSQAAMWRCLRAVWRWLDAEEQLSDKQQRYFAAQRLPCPKEHKKIREVYTNEQIDALLAACETENEREMYRDKAIILLLLESGMRVSELCSLTFESLDLRQRQAVIDAKGGDQRHVFWGPRCGAELAMHVLRSEKRSGALFLGMAQRNLGQPMTPDAVRSLVRRLAERASVRLPSRPVHAFRHTFARRALEAGVDGFYLQQLMGHSSPQVTARYVREAPGRLRRVHQAMFEQFYGGNNKAHVL